MQTKRFPFVKSGLLTTLCAVLIAGTAWAQNSGNINAAFQVARQSVNPDLQTKVVSVYGVGTPAVIQKWYVIFYDPSVPSHGRAVLVENGQIVKTYEARGGTTYDSKLTFDPSRISSEGPALAAAQGYAAQHHIAYDTVRALLKEKSVSSPFRWRIELIQSGQSRGYVYVNAIDDTVASYEAPTSVKSTANSAANSADATATGFAHDVKKTFLGIGGDLEQFFTGERTVDQ